MGILSRVARRRKKSTNSQCLFVFRSEKFMGIISRVATLRLLC